MNRCASRTLERQTVRYRLEQAVQDDRERVGSEELKPEREKAVQTLLRGEKAFVILPKVRDFPCLAISSPSLIFYGLFSPASTRHLTACLHGA